jgi:hypothetical protein
MTIDIYYLVTSEYRMIWKDRSHIHHTALCTGMIPTGTMRAELNSCERNTHKSRDFTRG